MKDQLITFESSQLLSTIPSYNQKECLNGFLHDGQESNDYSLDWINGKAIARPSQTTVREFLRTKYDIEVETFSSWESSIGRYYVMYVKIQPETSQAKVIYNPATILATLKAQDPTCDIHQFKYKTHEQAVESGIFQALTYIINNNKN